MSKSLLRYFLFIYIFSIILELRISDIMSDKKINRYNYVDIIVWILI